MPGLENGITDHGFARMTSQNANPRTGVDCQDSCRSFLDQVVGQARNRAVHQ